MRVIRAYVQERANESDFQDMTEDVYQKNIHVERIDALFNPVTTVITGISYIIGLSYGTYLVFHQEISLGNLVAFNVYLGMLIWPMFAIGELINIMQRGSASLDRVQNTLNHEEDVKDPLEPKTIESPDHIHFSNVTFGILQLKQIISRAFPLKLNAGQRLVLSEKQVVEKRRSSSNYCVNIQWAMEISPFDVSMSDQTKDQVRRWMGYVPQDHVLFSRSIRENILFGEESATDAELKAAIRLAYFEKDVEMLPEGLETLVGEKGVALSGGQKQRISIARALIKNPNY